MVWKGGGAMLRILMAWVCWLSISGFCQADPLPGTKPLTMEGDLASEMVAGIDRFLLGQIEQTRTERLKEWKAAFADAESLDAFRAEKRKALAKMLGVVDPRLSFDEFEVLKTSDSVDAKWTASTVRWPVLGFPGPSWPDQPSIFGEGLWLQPLNGYPNRAVIVIPDADQTPEELAGITGDLSADRQYARQLVERGYSVLVPTLISRETAKRNGRANLTNREYLYRSAFVLGRHLVGYEVQTVLAGVDFLNRTAPNAKQFPISILGTGEGGMIALYAAALDDRIAATCVGGYFGPRERSWEEPISRNVFGRLQHFGDAELAAMIAPRKLIVLDAEYPVLELPGEGGAPAKLGRVASGDVQAEVDRARQILPEELKTSIRVVRSEPVPELLDSVNLPNRKLYKSGSPPKWLVDSTERQRRLLANADRHNQWLLRESPYVRDKFFENLKTDSLEAFEESVEDYRTIFREEVIGKFDIEPLPMNPRSRKTWDNEKWTGYEVVLDVFPDVFAYGVLLIPKGIEEGEKRPVVVCQHGLEGRPTDTFLDDHRAYHDFAAKLAERGFIVFAPQNPYLFQDRFRTLQRKANPLGKTLFSIIVPQHQQIVDWLQTLPNVDPDRIGFYGLSYGGKSAMRIPALVTDYALSICSADFNEWVWKNASTRAKHSYVWTGEYEIFEFNLGETFNYAEMAALIAPRPFMVERGHFDGVAPDETVAAEFAKVRFLYNARLGIGDRCEIEWFVGPHTIHGQGTFDFLHRFLDWPKPTP